MAEDEDPTTDLPPPVDTDGDGILDGEEIKLGTDPDDDPALRGDPPPDEDSDAASSSA